MSFEHWHLELDDRQIAWVSIDQASARVNTLTSAVLSELKGVLTELARLRPAGVVFRSAKTTGFIAGADINEFVGIESEQQARERITQAHAIFNLLEALPFPTLAAIRGHCLGGGLELALACRYRIACDSPDTRLGLPEVRLGIHPGFGGSARLIRLIGAPSAMSLMLTGRSLDARRAASAGIVDHAVPPRQFARAAAALLAERPPPRRAPPWLALLNHGLARPWFARFLEHRTASKVRREHYPAPFALIDLWRRHGGTCSRMLRHEIDSVAHLVIGSTARHLVRAYFLQERLKQHHGDLWPAAPRVHVIGAGTMGGDIAAWCAYKGCTVSVHDQDPRMIAAALKRGKRLLDRRVADRVRRQAALDRLVPDPRGRYLARADVVIEAIVEDLPAKQELLRSIEPLTKDEALLASNTSSIPLEDIARAMQRPERLLGMHFFNPVAQMPLVELIETGANRDRQLEKARAFVRFIDRLPLVVRSSPGFLVNRVLFPYLLEAVLLHDEQVPIGAIDAAARAFGMPMGPVELADTVGLDVCLAVGQHLADRFGTTVPERLRRQVESGRLGKKTRRGFYEYRNGRPLTGPQPDSPLPASAITDRLILRLCNEALACLRQGIVGDADLIDAGLIFGAGFAPFRGGPLTYLRDSGLANLHERMQALEQNLGERFKPDPGWRLLGEQGSSGT